MRGRREMAPAWSPVSLVDMAYRVGLGGYAFYAYNMPLLQAHPSAKGTPWAV